MIKKNIYDYTKTEINEMKRDELLKIKYEQDKFYFEYVSGSDKKWHENNPFEKYCQRFKQYTIRELRKMIVVK